MFDLSKIAEQFLYDPKNPLLFNNGFFVFFFMAFLVLYYTFRNQVKTRTYITCFFSLYFFYKASGSFVLLVILSAIVDYVLSNLIYRQTNKHTKKLLLICSIVFNVGMLFYFKYTNFFIGVCNDAFKAHFNPLNILLPVGISFYTFENLSYTIDVYRGEFKPARKFRDYLLFLSFFPKLVMGPIVRAHDFIPQLGKPYYVSTEDFSKGFYLIVTGLFKKLVVSDYITLNLVNFVFDEPSRYTGMECLLALYGYAIVIYCDFSGYSDVAIGMARWLGIKIPANFMLPYQSKNITEFWRRWHISLSSWLRDYIYIPLGGNRKGKARAYLNQFITMLIGGFWHGASWNFVLWGALHGASLSVHKQYKTFFPGSGKTNRFIAALCVFVTFNWVCFCWIFFKSSSLENSFVFMRQIVSNFDLKVFPEFFANYKPVIAMILLGFIMHTASENFITNICKWLEKRSLATYVIIFLISIFIYLQFKSAEPVMPIYLQF